MRGGTIRNFVLVAASVVMLVACGSVPVAETSATRSPSGPATASPIASPTLSLAWKAITDATYGYTIGYPPDWSEVTAREPDLAAGIHVMATRPELLNPAERFGAQDAFLSVVAGPPQPIVGCSEPVGVSPKAITLDGWPANQYLRTPDQIQGHLLVIDAIAKYNGICYQIQLSTGSAIGVTQALQLAAQIEATFRFKN